MPELPEVEILARHLAPLLKGRMVRRVEIRRPKVIAPTSEAELSATLSGARFIDLARRGKYLLFTLTKSRSQPPIKLVGHLGMTGRMFLATKRSALPRHVAVLLDLGRHNFVFEDTRYFGRFTLDAGGPAKLGPEPLSEEFTPEYMEQSLRNSSQSIKVKLLDQRLVAGVGNIYASEALFRAGIPPRFAARRLTRSQIGRMWQGIRDVLSEAIRLGSSMALNFDGRGERDGLFYHGSAAGAASDVENRFMVYDRAGEPCFRCGTVIKRVVQAGRSTFYCPGFCGGTKDGTDSPQRPAGAGTSWENAEREKSKIARLV